MRVGCRFGCGFSAGSGFGTTGTGRCSFSVRDGGDSGGLLAGCGRIRCNVTLSFVAVSGFDDLTESRNRPECSNRERTSPMETAVRFTVKVLGLGNAERQFS